MIQARLFRAEEGAILCVDIIDSSPFKTYILSATINRQPPCNTSLIQGTHDSIGYVWINFFTMEYNIL